MYVKIFWTSWNWSSYSRECLRYWLLWRLVVKTSALTDQMPKTASRYYLLWLWRHIQTQHWSCLSEPTDYKNSPKSGCKIQNAVITGYSSQPRMNGPLSSSSWKFWGQCNIRPCGCPRGIWSHCITLSQTTMTCSILSMASCELWLRRRPNGRKTCSAREVSMTEAVEIVCWSHSADGYASHCCTYPRSCPEGAIL